MILKWIFDRAVALLGLLFLWPVLVVVAVLVKIKMLGGPVFFVQDRVRKDGRIFRCHKFRTMRVRTVVAFSGEAVAPSTGSGTGSGEGCVTGSVEGSVNTSDDSSGIGNTDGWSSVSVAGDSRITPLGAVLRHYKLDELPELWDVLVGNMSFVGPRPDVPGYADRLEGSDRDVLKLRPGITGPATLKYRLEDEMISEYVASRQAAGDARPMQKIATEYNDSEIYPDKVRLNCFYYRHYSFLKDIEMIFATVLGFKVRFAGEEV